MKHFELEQIRRDKHYRVCAAAYVLNVSRQTIYRYIENGRLAINEKLYKAGLPYIKGWSIIAQIR